MTPGLFAAAAAAAESSDDDEDDDGGGGGGAIGGYRRPKTFKKSAGRSVKIHSKGAKGGVACYVNGAGEPVEQGSNSNIEQHAERLGVGAALRSRGRANIALSQNAWPCPPCHAWLRGCANSEQITITVTVTGDHGGYAGGHGKLPDATGVITYHPDGSFTYA